MLRFLLLIASLIIVVLVSVFTLENLAPVSINFLLQKMQAPPGITMLSCFITAAMAGVLFNISLARKHKRRVQALTRKIAVVGQEVINLRQLPIKNPH